MTFLNKKRNVEGMQTKINSANPTTVKNVIAEVWGNIFSSKVSEKYNSQMYTVMKNFQNKKEKLQSANSSQLLAEISEEELRKAIMAQSNKKQPGPDRIQNEIWKLLANNVDFILVFSVILSACMSHSTTPKAWNHNIIYLIYKDGDPADATNYRPIALLNTSYKIFTYIINKRLSRFLETNDIFSNMQGGFRQGKTTYTKIWTLAQIIENAKKNKNPLHVCYINIKN